MAGGRSGVVRGAAGAGRPGRAGSAGAARGVRARSGGPPRPWAEGKGAPKGAGPAPPASTPLMQRRRTEEEFAKRGDDNVAAEEQEAAADTGGVPAADPVPVRVRVGARSCAKQLPHSSARRPPGPLVGPAAPLSA